MDNRLVYAESIIIKGYCICGNNNWNINPQLFAEYLMKCLDLDFINNISIQYGKALMTIIARINTFNTRLVIFESMQAVFTNEIKIKITI